MLLYVLTVIALMRNVTCSKIKAVEDIRTETLQVKTGVIFQQILALPTPTWVAYSLWKETILWLVLNAPSPFFTQRPQSLRSL